MILPAGVTQWLMADEWMSFVTLNGVDVSDICRGVLMNGEVPYAVELLELSDRGRPFVRRDGRLATRIERGTIRVEGLRSRKPP